MYYMKPIYDDFTIDQNGNPVKNEITNFEKVEEFNKVFGVTNQKEFQNDIFENDKLVNYRMSLITEEYTELCDAVKNKDITETIDALSDILFVVYGFYTAIGVNADDAFDIVYKSNMSKVCLTEEEAIESVKRYTEEIPQRYDSPSYKKAPDNKRWLVYNKNTNKILKSYKYTEAKFDTLMNVEECENTLIDAPSRSLKEIMSNPTKRDLKLFKFYEKSIIARNGDLRFGIDIPATFEDPDVDYPSDDEDDQNMKTGLSEVVEECEENVHKYDNIQVVDQVSKYKNLNISSISI